MLIPQRPTVIVLAAGFGRRFAQSGGAAHKLNALLGGVPVLQRVLRTVALSGLPFHLVRPEEGAAAETAGMGDSIARGVRATADAAGWLILPGDLPLLSVDSLLQVARELAAHAVVLPLYQQQQGHPVGFGPGCFEALSTLGGDRGAAAVVRTHRQAGTAQILHLNDPGIVTDIDTLDDLAQAERLLATGNH